MSVGLLSVHVVFIMSVILDLPFLVIFIWGNREEIGRDCSGVLREVIRGQVSDALLRTCNAV